jgi:hypothetical protein
VTEPVIYVSTFRLKEGKFEQYQRFFAELLKVVEDNNPQLIALHAFANEDGTEMTSVNVHPDAASMEYHMQVLAEKMGLLADDLTEVFQFMEPVRIEVYGTPGERATEMDKPLMEQQGVPFIFKSHYIGGFTRPSAT